MKPRILTALIASLGLAGTLSSAAGAQPESAQSEDSREARVILPRLQDDSVDTDNLVREMRQFFRNGVRDVRIRDLDLNAQDRLQLSEVARRLSAEFGQSVRVLDEGSRLRVVMRSEQEASTDGHEDRHRDDRVERREDRLPVERAEAGVRPERSQAVERPERQERAERTERQERVERRERPEKADRPDRKERLDRHERRERSDRD